jgi:hypothetical protein
VNDPERDIFKRLLVEDALKLNKMDKRNDIAIAEALASPCPDY